MKLFGKRIPYDTTRQNEISYSRNIWEGLNKMSYSRNIRLGLNKFLYKRNIRGTGYVRFSHSRNITHILTY